LNFSEAIDKAIQDAEAQKAKSFATQGKYYCLYSCFMFWF
jgi:hypothetical protein